MANTDSENLAPTGTLTKCSNCSKTYPESFKKCERCRQVDREYQKRKKELKRRNTTADEEQSKRPKHAPRQADPHGDSDSYPNVEDSDAEDDAQVRRY